MKITKRDIELMGWVLEQKVMTRKQIRQIFWKDISDKSIEDYRRLNELKKEGYLKTSKKEIYKEILYLVTGKGVKQLRAFSRNRGLCELCDAGYSNYKHDGVVTDIRVMLHKWGYEDWVSERVMARRNDLRRLPDGIIHHRGKYFAIEYEATQKSKSRYREIFYNYELDDSIDHVVYVVDTPELVTKMSELAATCGKIFFVQLEDLEENQVNASLSNEFDQLTLHELLEVRN